MLREATIALTQCRVRGTRYTDGEDCFLSRLRVCNRGSVALTSDTLTSLAASLVVLLFWFAATMGE